jgi:hypothetical protein
MSNDLNMRIEKDGNEWVAILPPHPDMPDEELGLPGATREEAEAEGRAYRAIEQSSLYKFDFDEGRGVYVVSVGKEGEKYEAPLLAEAYRLAQEAYTKRVSEPPPADKPLDTPTIKPGRPRKAVQSNGSDSTPPKGDNPPPGTLGRIKAVAPDPQVPPNLPKQAEPITSGNQLQDAAHRARIDRLEAVLVVFARTILKELKDEK